jgi:hypothetical protein
MSLNLSLVRENAAVRSLNFKRLTYSLYVARHLAGSPQRFARHRRFPLWLAAATLLAISLR